MKKLLAAMLIVLLSVGAAWAVEVELTGSYYARGSWFSNPDGNLKGDFDPYSNYDHELDVRATLRVSDNAFIYSRYEIKDETWPGDEPADGSPDDQIEVQRLYGQYTFGYGGVLAVGSMTGGAWAYSFADNGGERYRVKYTQPTGIGPVIGILEKNAENGSSTKKTENDDNDAYYLANVAKLGNMNLNTLLGYVVIGDNGIAEPGDDKTDTTMLIDIGLDGAFGALGFETEFQYKSYGFDAEPKPDDYSLYGFMADLWWNFGAGKVGGVFAYGSVDKDSGKGFGFGDDFDGHGSELLGNSFGFGGADMIYGSTFFALYGTYTATDALSFFAQIAYASANSDLDQGAYVIEKDTCMDFTLTGTYKLTDAVSYKIGGGYAQISKDVGDDPDPATKLYHRFDIAF